MDHTATYSPDDNKLRLYPACRLDAETYARVKAAGFAWAPKQELFVAGMWTPAREDLLIELCGEIGDDDSSLVDRAEDRAERFEEYGEKRLADAHRAREAVDKIADGIPLGQPILVGHHSERHARKDAERIENGMRKAVRMWETSKYWESRAAGAIRHAKYKERPDVRHRRIKTIEADRRKIERRKSEADMWRKLWTACGKEQDKELQHGVALRLAGMCNLDLPRKEGDREGHPHTPSAYTALRNDFPDLYAPRTIDEIVAHAARVYPATMADCDRWLAHYDNRLAYEKAMLAAAIGGDEGDAPKTMADRFPLAVGGKITTRRGETLTIVRVNRKDGVATSVTTTAPAGVTWQRTWKYGVEEIAAYEPPTEEQTDKVRAATKLPPLCNYPGDGFREMTDAEWTGRKKWSDFSYVRKVDATAAHGAHRARFMPVPGKMWERQQVFITDAKRVDPPVIRDESLFEPPAGIPPAATDSPPAAPSLDSEPAEPGARLVAGYAAPRPRNDSPDDAAFLALKEGLKAGVRVAVAPQLFPTPDDLARRVVREIADVKPGERILEPSAGTGAILRHVWGAIISPDCGHVTAVEINPGLAEQLREDRRRRVYANDSNFVIHCGDFLECAPEELGTFHKIVMNSPFANGADIKHIEHARRFLKPGGRLVAICANGPRQRDKLQAIATHWEELPAGTFKEAGTNVNTALVVIDRPAETAQAAE